MVSTIMVSVHFATSHSQIWILTCDIIIMNWKVLWGFSKHCSTKCLWFETAKKVIQTNLLNKNTKIVRYCFKRTYMEISAAKFVAHAKLNLEKKILYYRTQIWYITLHLLVHPRHRRRFQLQCHWQDHHKPIPTHRQPRPPVFQHKVIHHLSILVCL